MRRLNPSSLFSGILPSLSGLAVWAGYAAVGFALWMVLYVTESWLEKRIARKYYRDRQVTEDQVL